MSLLGHQMSNDIAEPEICVNCGVSSMMIEDFRPECGQKWARKNHTVVDLVKGEAEHYKSINKAKRESHRLQTADKGLLGTGKLRVYG